MYGFKPQHARGKPVQNYADGGLVQRLKRVVGLDDEHNARVAEYRANKAAAAAQAPVQPPTASAAPAQPTKALSDYGGMTATQRREKELGLKDGGRVEPRGFVSGKGTGTSDSIKARLSNGEYVLPADTVKAVGVDALDALRAATHTPVKHEQAKAAHGFFAGGTPGGVDEDWQRKMESDRNARQQQSNAIASEAMAQSQAESDKLAAQSSLPKTTIGGLANNGGADASRFAQVPAPIGTQPNRTPEPATPGAPLSVPQPAAQTDPAKVPLGQMHSIGARSGAQMVADGARSGAQSFFDSFQKAPDAPAVAPSAAAPAGLPGYKTDVQRGGGNVPAVVDPTATANAQEPTKPATAPAAAATGNVTRVGNSYSGGNVAGDITVNGQAPRGGFMSTGDSARSPVGMTVEQAQREGLIGARVGYSPANDERLTGAKGAPSAQNMAAADALAQRSQQESMSRVSAQQPAGFTPAGMQAPTVRHSGNDWQSRNDLRNAMVSATSIMNDGGKWDKHGKGVVSPERAYAMELAKTDAALRGAQPGVDVAAMRENAGIQREGMQQTGATTRTGMQEQGANARAEGRNAIERDEFGLKKEAAGFQTRAAKRLEDLQASYQSAKTPEERAAIAQQLRELQGKGDGNLRENFMTVGGGQEWDAQAGVMRNVPQRLVDLRSGQEVSGQQAPALPKGMKRQIGTSNGRPVYEDMNGKQVIAKG